MIKMKCNRCGEKACRWEIPTDMTWDEIRECLKRHEAEVCPISGTKTKWEAE